MKAIATFLVIFGARINIVFIIKVKIIVLIKWSYRSSQFMLTSEYKMAMSMEIFLT